MTEPTPEVEVDRSSIAEDRDFTAESGDAIIEALNKLNERVDALQALALEEHKQAADFQGVLNRLQDIAGCDSPEEFESELRRLKGLDTEGKEWGRERETILKTVEGLIHKVDSLAGQL